MRTNLFFPPNTSVEFSSKTFTMRVSLNVPQELLPFMKRKVFHTQRGKFVIASTETRPAPYFTPAYADELYNKILKNLMIEVRQAKAEMYAHQAQMLKQSRNYVQLSLFTT